MAKKGSILLNLLNFSPDKIKDIVANFSDIDNLLEARQKDLHKIASLTNSDISNILNMQDSQAFRNEIYLIEKEKIYCLDIFDNDYPSLLKKIDYPPLVLYIKGNFQILNKFLFAIVGSRNPTTRGISLAESYSYQLSALGWVIVSGLARGIDTAAHQGAIRKGLTVAVLGSGLLNIYPKQNRKLAGDISLQGAVISEFPLQTPPLKENFPRRNRIISGLSRGVLVVEAAVRSGALITAHLACEQNREVFALPGNIDSPLSKGTHSLIKEGAKLVDSLDDILEEFKMNLPILW